MFVIRDQSIPASGTPGNFTGGLATLSRGATQVSIIRQRQIPNAANPAHRHDQEEVMVQLAGTVTVTVAGEAVTLAPGDTLIVPAETVHQIANTGGGAAEWLIVAPAGVRYFHPSGEEILPDWAR